MDKGAQRAQWLQDVDVAHRVAEFLQDPILQDVLKRIETQAIQQWRDSEDYSKSLQSDAWHRVRILDEIRGELESLVTTGQIAARNLEGAKSGQS